MTFARDLVASLTCGIGNGAKTLTHFLYKIGGDMPLEERIIKTNVPIGFDKDAVATGKKILIGLSARDMWHYWLEIDKPPSGQTLHQTGSKSATDDNRVIKFHR